MESKGLTVLVTIAGVLNHFFLSVTSMQDTGRNITCPETVCECREINFEDRGLEKVIDCQGLGLSEVPNFLAFMGYNFDSLLLNDNKITSVSRDAFRGLNVKRIELSHNPDLNSFSNKAFRYIAMLEVLKIEHAGLSSVPVALKELPELRELHLRNNDIRRLPSSAFADMSQLRHFDMANNQAEFPMGFDSFEQLRELEYLNFENNGLYNIPTDAIRDKPKLKSLILGHNHIHNVPMESLQPLTSLRRLELVGNPIKFTKPENGIFPGLDLEVLSVGGCVMDKIAPQTLNGFPKLKNLTIRECQIKSIPKGTFKNLRHLRALDVSGNPFRLSKEVFYGVESQLDYLKLEKMNLTDYPLDLLGRFARLKDIFLSGNKIEFLPGGIFRKLPYRGSRIFVENNNINTVSKHLMDSARRPSSLFLAHNQIRSLDFISQHPCRYDDVYLDLTDNPVHCDCATYEMIQRKIFELVGTCQTPPQHEKLKLLYWPTGNKIATDTSSEIEPAAGSVVHFEHGVNMTQDCRAQHRLNQRFECTCGTWQDVNSPVVCAVIGAADNLKSISYTAGLILIYSLLNYLW